MSAAPCILNVVRGDKDRWDLLGQVLIRASYGERLGDVYGNL